MRIFIIAEYAFIFCGLVALFSQIVVPGLRNRPLFPILRDKRRLAETDLANELERRDVKNLQRETKEAKVVKRRVSS